MDKIILNEGWNLIGGINEICSYEIISGYVIPNTLYTYSNEHYLLSHNKLIPKKAYWIRASQETVIKFREISLEFSGLKWYIERNTTVYNNELQVYKKSQIELIDEKLYIKVKKQGNQYYSGRINTGFDDSIKISPGQKLEIEYTAKMPIAYDINGNKITNVPLWPALWLMGRNIFTENIGWPFCGELDVLEWSPVGPNNLDNYHYTTAIHFNNGNQYNPQFIGGEQIETSIDITKSFNSYKVIIYSYQNINNNKIEMWFNNKLKNTYTNLTETQLELFRTLNSDGVILDNNKEYGLIMNIAVGGNYTGITNIGDIPSNFDNAEMIIENVEFNILSL